jgi:tellurite resistance protein
VGNGWIPKSGPPDGLPEERFMKPVHEQVEVIKAAIVLAVADGKLSAGERGLLEGLAQRVGIGQASLNAMVERAKSSPAAREELFRHQPSDPEQVMELLVATARLDGEIADAERQLLVDIMQRLGIAAERFAAVYQRGVARADALRKAKRG